MYKIDYNDSVDALRILYCFMILQTLFHSECSVMGRTGILRFLTGEEAQKLGRNAFYRAVALPDLSAIICVASTDRADKRRVVLTFMPELRLLTLNFPALEGKLGNAEHDLIRMLKAEPC